MSVVFTAILCVMVVLLLIIILRGLLFTSGKQAQGEQIETEIDENQAVENLQQLIRCKTVSYEDRSLEDDAAFAQAVDGREDIVGRQGDMLDAFALIVLDELLDLAVFVLAFVQRDADGAVGRDHRLAEQPGRLALDVEVLLEVAHHEDVLRVVDQRL